IFFSQSTLQYQHEHHQQIHSFPTRRSSDLLEFVYAIPREKIVRVGMRRALMRRALVGIVPDELLNRKRKFFVPPDANPQQQKPEDRKSTRLNSSHVAISYAVFCLKKKNNRQ